MYIFHSKILKVDLQMSGICLFAGENPQKYKLMNKKNVTMQYAQYSGFFVPFDHEFVGLIISQCTVTILYR